MGGQLPGGWPEIMQANRALALEARAVLLQSLAAGAPCPQTMIGSMAAIPLPAAEAGSAAERLDHKGLHDWFRERGVETWLYPSPVPLLRISAQLYNHLSQYRRLADLLAEALRGR
jgi:isopenicillin-N epimerase